MAAFASRLAAFALAAVASTTAAAQENVMVVFDGSNSMWGQIDGVAKIEIARGVMQNLLGSWTDDRRVGLMAYGHRQRGDCTDIEVLVQPEANARADILARINAITPTGKTPLTDAVEQAARLLSYTDTPATVVLISDGLESCERDPCALAEALEQGGVDFTAHVVGFGLAGDEDSASLSCIAEKTGGKYFSARNATELGAALSEVGTAVAEAPPPPPAAPDVAIQGPGSALAGSLFPVAWTPTVAPADYVTIVPVGTPEGQYGNYLNVGADSQGNLRAPAFAGAYELRYLHAATSKVLGRAAIQVLEPEVTVAAPDSVLTGAAFPVAWTGAVDFNDYVTVVPMGAEEGTYASYALVKDLMQADLTAAAEPGLYEVRYVLREGTRTLARKQIEVVEANVTLGAPETALTGEEVTISWTGTVNGDDYITIVPVGADEGTYGTFFAVRDLAEQALVAPAQPGMYEVRYVLREGARTLARKPIEITEPQIALTAPETAVTGSTFTVGWDRTVNTQDYINIVPAAADEGKFGNYIVVRDDKEGELTAPSEPGLYEVRYVLREGSRTMGSKPIEIVASEVTLTVPASATTGSDFPVSWTGTVNSQDYINIVPAGADEGDFGNYFVVRDDTKGKLRAPAEPGLYEVRYVLRESSLTLARASIEITAPEVTVTAPDQAVTGSKFRVSWTGTVNSQDYINIVPSGADEGEFGNYFVVRENTEGELTAPAAPGLFEVRYVLREGNRTMARETIEITEPEITLSAPATATAGSKIHVGWTGAVNTQDYINIVPAGAEEGEFGNYFVVREASEGDLQAPAEPGLYEIRYVLREGNRTMANRSIEITEPQVTVSGPEKVRAGDKLKVSWTGTVHTGDYIALEAMGSEDGKLTNYQPVSNRTSVELKAPDETGVFELRYVLREGQRVLAREVIEVVAADAQLESGASLSAPDTAAPGAEVDVGWTVSAESADQRIALAREDQAIFTWVQAVKVEGTPPVKLTMPEAPGTYEIRFLDVTNQAVLARKVIRVE